MIFDRRRTIARSMINARAAIEQMSSGQIGQPAACIIESNRGPFLWPPWDRREFRCARIMAWRRGSLWRRSSGMQRTRPDVRQGTRKLVHQRRGQLCGQLAFVAAADQQRRALDCIAELLSRIKVFEINDLHRRGAGLRGISRRRASIGAAVELSARASLGFADE